MTRTTNTLNLALWALLCAITVEVKGQTMLEGVRSGWSVFVFVSTSMPRTELIGLAREASLANAKLVLRGLPTNAAAAVGPLDFQSLATFAGSINAECCRGRGAAWIVDPRLFDRYAVKAAPTFVLANGESGNPANFARLEGGMSLGNALKFMAQDSRSAEVRRQATAAYGRAFGGRL